MLSREELSVGKGRQANFVIAVHNFICVRRLYVGCLSERRDRNANRTKQLAIVKVSNKDIDLDKNTADGLVDTNRNKRETDTVPIVNNTN